MNLNKKELINKLSKITSINSEIMLFEIKNKKLWLRAYNEYIKIQSFIDGVESNDNFQCVVNPKVLLNILSKIKTDMVHISLIEDQLVLRSNKTTLNLNSINKDEFHLFNLEDDESFQLIPLGMKEYTEIYRYVLPYCSEAQNTQEAHLSNTNCIDIQNEDDELYAYATDYKRIVSYKLLDKFETKMNLIIYSKCFSWITKIFNEEDQIETKLTQTNLILKTQTDIIEVSLMQITFPNVKAVIDNKKINVIKVNTNELIDALERGLVITKADTTLVVCDFNGNDLLLSFKNSEKGYVSDVVKIQNTKGEMSSFCINIHYLLIALRNVNSNEVIFSMEDNLSALYVYSEKSDKLLQAILPTKNIWN